MLKNTNKVSKIFCGVSQSIIDADYNDNFIDLIFEWRTQHQGL